ncbi:beta-propeller domain-containing protein [Ornithinimicrobium sp. Y1847]|uniref:beta-propeller domain-containing protein n=1 Tax=Ornithinimicrobium sp. Y1847 TaxID=3405419 RepID=UPI003B679853
MPRTTRTTWTASLLALPLAAGAMLTGCSSPPDRPGSGDTPTTTAAWDTVQAGAAITALPAGFLQPFDDCSELLTYYQANALELVTPYGLGAGRGYHGGAVDEAGTADAAAGAESVDGSLAGASASGPDHSTTNVQEEGVDEADVVKTNGTIIVAISSSRVQIVDVATEKVISTITMPGRRENAYPSELLLHGDTLVILGQEWASAQPLRDHFLPFEAGRTLITTVDISDPASPRTVGTMRVEGSYRSARMIDDTIRLVMVSEPTGLQLTGPRTNSLRAEDEAEQRNRELVRATTIDDWIPHRQHLDADGQVISTEPLLGCDQISRPRDPAGLSTLSVLSFKVGEAAPTSGTGLVASGATVYASPDRLIVATSPWDMWNWMPMDTSWMRGTPSVNTDLHAFDISDPDATSYVASGSVGGRIINQWALDEQEGVIRVATTTDPPGASQASHSSLIMLREDGDQLAETGRVDDLGVTEEIQSVRYLSKDVAAIVTFRQVDPLYLIDTSDPTNPTVAGELKIPGYSAYLHPVGDGWLLGVGQDADEQTGQTKGAQASLFDIRDLSNPQQTEVVVWKDSYSPVESDHRAFTYWPRTGQVFIPITQWTDNGEGNFGGVQTLSVAEGTLTDGDRVSTAAPNQTWGEAPMRTIVIGDDLWTLDYQGLGRYDLATLEGGWAVDLP